MLPDFITLTTQPQYIPAANARRSRLLKHPLAMTAETDALARVEELRREITAGAAQSQQDRDASAARASAARIALNDVEALVEIGEASVDERDAARRTLEEAQAAHDAVIGRVRRAVVQLPYVERQASESRRALGAAVVQATDADVEDLKAALRRALEVNARLADAEDAAEVALQSAVGSVAPSWNRRQLPARAVDGLTRHLDSL